MKPTFALSALLAVSVMLSAGPAWASLASETFKDVQDGHWAQEGIAELAIKRDMMRGYPDGTFRGELPFTRFQFALAMKELVAELERISRTNLRQENPCLNTYADLTNPTDREVVLELANAYCLFEGVPGIRTDRFDPEQQVTRTEVSKVIANLMELADRKGIVRPRNANDYTFSDVARDHWAYEAIQTVSDRYGVMIGFPDNTFRPNDQLTRYQFAQAGFQTVPLIRELVTRTLEEKATERALEHARRWQEQTPYHLALTWGPGLPSEVGLEARWIGYPGPFAMLDMRLLNASATHGTLGDLFAGVGLPNLMLGQVHLAPYAGPRFAYASNGTTGNVAAGLGAGLAAYSRLTPTWGVLGNARGTMPFISAGAAGAFLWNGDLEVEYFLAPKVALVGGFGMASDPVNGLPISTFKFGTHFGF